MAEPLTDDQLAEIHERADAVTGLQLAILVRQDVPELLGEVERLKEENKELNDLFDLQWTRMSEATTYWQRRTGRHDVHPDLGDLLKFLLDEVDG